MRLQRAHGEDQRVHDVGAVAGASSPRLRVADDAGGVPDEPVQRLVRLHGQRRGVPRVVRGRTQRVPTGSQSDPRVVVTARRRTARFRARREREAPRGRADRTAFRLSRRPPRSGAIADRSPRPRARAPARGRARSTTSARAPTGPGTARARPRRPASRRRRARARRAGGPAPAKTRVSAWARRILPRHRTREAHPASSRTRRRTRRGRWPPRPWYRGTALRALAPRASRYARTRCNLALTRFGIREACRVASSRLRVSSSTPNRVHQRQQTGRLPRVVTRARATTAVRGGRGHGDARGGHGERAGVPLGRGARTAAMSESDGTAVSSSPTTARARLPLASSVQSRQSSAPLAARPTRLSTRRRRTRRLPLTTPSRTALPTRTHADSDRGDVTASEFDPDDDSSFLPPFANAENRELDLRIREKERVLEELENDAEEHEDRVNAMREHLRNVEAEIANTQSRAEARRKEKETEAHMKRLSERAMARVRDDARRMEKEELELEERLANIDTASHKGIEKLRRAQAADELGVEELEQWPRRRERRGCALRLRSTRAPTRRACANELSHRARDEKVADTKGALEREVSETQAAQLELDRRREDFRAPRRAPGCRAAVGGCHRVDEAPRRRHPRRVSRLRQAAQGDSRQRRAC